MHFRDMVEEDRRTALKTIGGTALTAAALAGCMGGGDNTDSETSIAETPTASDIGESASTDNNEGEPTSTPGDKGQGETGSTGNAKEFDNRELLHGLPQIKEVNASGTQTIYNIPAGVVAMYDRAPEEALNYEGVKNNHPHGFVDGARPGEEIRGMAQIRPRLSGHEVIEMTPEEIFDSIKQNENTEVKGDKSKALVEYDDTAQKKHFEYLLHLHERGPKSTNLAFALKQEFEGEEDARPVEEPEKNLEAIVDTLNGNAPHILENEEYKEANQIHYDLIDGEGELPEFMREITPPEATIIAPAQHVSKQQEEHEQYTGMTTWGGVGNWFGKDDLILWKGYRVGEDGNIKEAGTSQTHFYTHEV